MLSSLQQRMNVVVRMELPHQEKNIIYSARKAKKHRECVVWRGREEAENKIPLDREKRREDGKK